MSGLNVGSVFFELGYNRGAFSKAVSEGSQRVSKIFGNTFGKASKQMSQQMSAAGKSVAASSVSASKQMANSYTKAMDATKVKALDAQVALDAVNEKMRVLSDAKKAEDTTLFNKMTASIKTTETELDSLIEKQQQVLEKQREDTGKKHNMASPPESLVRMDLEGNKAFNDLEAQIERLNAKLARMQNESQRAGQSLASGAQPATAEYQKLQAEADKLNTTLNQQKARTDYYKQALTEANEAANQYAASVNNAGKANNKFSSTAPKAVNSAKNIGRGMKDACKQSTGFGSRLLKLGTVVKGLVIGRLLRNMIRQVGEGFQSLAQVSQPFNAAMSQMKGQFVGVRNGIAAMVAPILQALAPAVVYLTNVLINALNVMSAFMAALFGGTATFIKATSVATNYAKGVGGAGGAAKKAKGQLAAFDELNNLNADDEADSGGGGGGGGGGGAVEAPAFETSPMLEGMAEFVEKFKALLEPARIALQGLGEELKRLGGFAWEGLKDFYNSFLKPVGTWVFGEGLPRFINAITNGLAAIDWGKINSSLHNLWVALTPFAINVGEGLLWFWENALVPLGSWTMNTVVPGFLGILSGAITIFNNTLEALKPLGSWLWKSFLQPLASWTGGVIDSILTGIGDALTVIGDWISNHQGIVQTMAILIGSFAAAWVLVNAAIVVWNIVGAIATGITGAFGAAVAFLTSPIGIVVLAIGALIAIVVLVAQNWEWIKEKAVEIWTAVSDFFVSVFTAIGDFFVNIWNSIKDFFINLWNSIVSFVTGIWNGISNFFSSILTSISNTFTAVWNGVKDFFVNIFNSIKEFIVNLWTNISTTVGNIITGIKNIFVNIFTSMKDAVLGVFNGIWNGIKGVINGILGGIESMANGVVSGVNMVIGALNTLKFGPIPDWVPLIGGKEFGFNIPTLSPVSLPRLAKGGIVDNPTVAMIGEAGKEAVVPLENNTGWMVSLANILADVLVSKLLMAQSGNSGYGQHSGESIKLEIDGREMGEVLLDYILAAAGRRGLTLIPTT